MPIWCSHHNDVNLNIFECVDAVYPRPFDRRLTFFRHAECGEKSDSGCKVVDDDAHMIHSLDCHAPIIASSNVKKPSKNNGSAKTKNGFLRVVDNVITYFQNSPYAYIPDFTK